MKNLAKATPTEFVTQTAKLARLLEAWIKDIEWDKLKKSNYVLLPVTEGLSKDEKVRAYSEYKMKVAKASRNLVMSVILNICEKCPEQSTEILALACFVDPAEKDSYTMEEYCAELSKMLESESVVGFFTSLVKSGLFHTSK